MLANANAFSSYSVNDLAAAKAFYRDVLGVNAEELPQGLRLKLDGTTVFLYPKPDHQPATFTVLNFKVDSVERAHAELESRGIRFERYDLPNLKTDEKGIARGGGGPTIAWFKDPAGNVISILE